MRHPYQTFNQGHYSAQESKAGVEAVQAATAEMKAAAKLIPSSVAVKGKFYGFTSWQPGAPKPRKQRT